VYGAGLWFGGDPHHDLEAVSESRRTLERYCSEYKELDGWPYPLRTLPARQTGLPALLKGYLSDPVNFDGRYGSENAIDLWLSRPLIAEALFGISQERARQRLDYASDSQAQWDPALELEKYPEAARQSQTLLHVRYQQRHQGWPVYGAQVSLHLAQGDLRAASSSSYFPLKESAAFQPPPDEEQARAVAKEAAFRALAYCVKDFEAIEWQAEAAPYAGSLLFIYPFIGDFDGEYRGNNFLAYQIEIVSSSGDQAWRVFVDADTGIVLGRPQSILAQVGVYPTSASLLAGLPTVLSNNELAELTTLDTVSAAPGLPALEPIHQLIDWVFHTNVDAAQGSLDLAPAALTAADNVLADAAATVAAKLKAKATLEAVNIAFHARKMYRYFVETCCADRLKVKEYADSNGAARKLRIRVGKGGVDLDMGFNHSTSFPKSISFQFDPGAGLNAGIGKKVFNPSLDPEVVYHELAHALMWMLNRAPFDDRNDTVPFGRAMIEGYANYFARSLAAGHGGDPVAASEPWARGAYQTDAIQWGDEWALGQDSSRSVANQLVPPNIYPAPAGGSHSLAVYDVGMIWARALWQIRSLFGPGLASSDLVDHLALDSYQYVPGWTPGFEMAAEGLIDRAIKLTPPLPVQDIITEFDRRGILAERGVQALAAAQDGAGNLLLLAGSDRGVFRFTGVAANPWEAWGGVNGVVGMAVDGDRIYVATEQGVFQRDPQNNTWLTKGQWPPGETPLSILAGSNQIFIGAANGIFQIGTNAAPGNGWQRWKNGGTRPLCWKMTAAQVPIAANEHFCFISNLTDRCEYAPLAGPSAQSWSSLPVVSQDARIVDIAILGNDIIAATAQHGIWRRQSTGFTAGINILTGPAWTPISSNNFSGRGVLCLGIDGRNDLNRLLAGATDGLYEENAGVWTQVNGVPHNVQVTCILSAGSLLVFGTSNNEVWLHDGTGWNSFPLPV
jgi:hypothetical protein